MEKKAFDRQDKGGLWLWLGLAAVIGLVVGFVIAGGWLIRRVMDLAAVEQQKPEPRRSPMPLFKKETNLLLASKTPNQIVPKKIDSEPVWRGKPSSLPSHEELMERIKKRHDVDPQAPAFPKPSSDFYILKREDFAKWADLPLEQNGIRFFPNFLGGRPRGMKVTELQAGSLMERMNLYKGDILLTINGRPAISPGYAQQIYKDIAKRSRNLTIQVQRGRKVHTLDFSLR